MNEIIFNIIIALIPVLGVILTYVVTQVAKKYGKNLDFKIAAYWTKIAVAIIEDKYGEDTGKLKKRDVLDFIKAQGISLCEEQMDLLIDAVVKELTLAGVINKNKKIEVKISEKMDIKTFNQKIGNKIINDI